MAHAKQQLPSKKNNLLFILAASATLLVVAAAAAEFSESQSGTPNNQMPYHSLLKSSCSSTLYPDLCYSAVATAFPFVASLSTQKDVILASLNLTISSAKESRLSVQDLIRTRSAKLTTREKTALDDCIETIDLTLDELHSTVADLHVYPLRKTLSQHSDDLKTLISAAITNQETCLDGFSHNDADRQVRQQLSKGQVHVEQMCSNALAMVKSLTDADIATEMARTGTSNRKLKEEAVREDVQWPEWIMAGDRRLLQAPSVMANVTVAADGSGDYRTVSAAVAAAPVKSEKRYVIRIKAGVYEENVEVPKKKTNIMFIGEGRGKTIITANRSVGDGSTTFKSATVAVVGANFLARDMTFENTAGHAKHQAVALRVGSDLSAFYNCEILAYQDTLYVHSNRQFFIQCLVAGTVDFIFGNGAAFLQDCDIQARLPGKGQKNMITAQGRMDPNQNTGIVIQKSRISAASDLEPVSGDFPTFLGRPWKEYSRTVIMQSTMSIHIHPAGWHEWNGEFGLRTLYYREYLNDGPGSGTSNRVNWTGFKVLSSTAEAEQFTARQFIGGGSWLGSTGFPFILGLK